MGAVPCPSGDNRITPLSYLGWIISYTSQYSIMAEKADKSKLILKILVGVLAVVCLALLIALIVVATRNNKEPVADNSSAAEDCPEKTKLSPQPARSTELYRDLSKEEIIAIRDYILRQSALNVTAYDKASIDDNYIYLIELQQPPKDKALQYLDDNAQQPERMARVVIYGGGKANPDVTEFLVGPAENPTKHSETKGPGQKYPIPFNARFADPKELDEVDRLVRNVTKHASRLLKESYDGYSMDKDCKEKCLTWGFTG